MSWSGRRRGHSTTNRIATADRQGIQEKITEYMENRRKFLAPFTVPVLDFIWSMHDSAMRPHVEILHKHYSKILQYEHNIAIKIDGLTPASEGLYGHGAQGKVFMRLALHGWTGDKLPPVPNVGWSEPEFTLMRHNPYHPEIIEWAQKWAKASFEMNTVLAAVDRVMSNASTLGQARRIWPELAEFFTQAQLERAPFKKASPLPSSCYVHVDEGDGVMATTKELKPEWTPEAFAPLNLLLAEALMMPKVEQAEFAALP